MASSRTHNRILKNKYICWACIILLGVLGFFLVGISSYFGQDLIPLLSSQRIIFVPHGIIMCFYGIADVFLSFYLWCTILWNIGSGYNQFGKQEEMVHLFCWGFLGGNHRICIQFFHERYPSNTYGSPIRYLSLSNYLYENKGSTRCSYNSYLRGFNPKRNGRKSCKVGSLSARIN